MDNPSFSPPLSMTPQQDITGTVLELRHLTTALSAFHRRYDDLKSHLNFISSSIDVLLNSHSQTISPISDQTLVLEQSIVSPFEKSPISSHEETLLSKNHIFSDQTLISEATPISPLEETPISEKSPIFHPGKPLISKNPQISPPKETLISEKALIEEKTLISEQIPVSPTEGTPISEKSPISHPGKTLISKNPQTSPPKETLISEKALIEEKTLISEQIPVSPTEDTPISEKPSISHPGKALISKNPQISPPKEILISEKALIEEQALIPSPLEKSIISEQCPSSHPGKITSPKQSEIVSLCKSMKGNSLRKYLLSRLSEPEKLLEEVPEALKQCPNPSKLVLDCLGQFYLLGAANAYKINQSLNRSRMVTIIMLECFLIAECDVSESLIKDLAETAMEWRKRMVNESGISTVSEIDAKGLLLFIGCFGIPDDFEDDDVLYLVRLSNGKDFLGLLRRSKILIKKMKEILEAKQKENKDVEALDVALTFGLKARYSPIILFKNQLADLKSLEKCLEEHKVDPSDLLSDWHPKKRMGQIERELTELEKKLERCEQKAHAKRKTDQPKPSKKAKEKKMKDAHLSRGLEQQKVVSPHVDPDIVFPRPYQIDGALVNERFVGRGLGVPERFVGPSGIGPERFVGPSGIGSERFVGPSGIGPERFVGPSHIGPERFVGRSYAEPFIHAAANGLGPSPLSDPYTGYMKPPPAGFSGFPGLSSKSDLYSFADAVIEAEANGGSVPSAPFTHRPSHRY